MKPNLRLLPTEVWVDVFCFAFPLSSRLRLGQLVDRIGNYNFAEFLQFYLHDFGKHTLANELIFAKEGMLKACWLFDQIFPRHVRVSVPIAQTEMPENIKSFSNIMIKHFDAQTLGFLRRIQPLLGNVNIMTCMDGTANLRTILAHLSPLLGQICSLHFLESLGNNGSLPPIPQWECFAAECGDQLAKLKVLQYSHNRIWGPEPEPSAEEVEAVRASITFFLNWLTSREQQRDCTEPRLFDTTFRCVKLFQQASMAIQEEFLSAKSPCTFVVKLWLCVHESIFNFDLIADFHLENNNREQLHGQKIEKEQEHGYKYKYFQIVRHQPNVNAGTQLQEWVEETEQQCRKSRFSFWDWDKTIGQIDATGGEEVDDGGEGKAADQPSTSKQH